MYRVLFIARVIDGLEASIVVILITQSLFFLPLCFSKELQLPCKEIMYRQHLKDQHFTILYTLLSGYPKKYPSQISTYVPCCDVGKTMANMCTAKSHTGSKLILSREFVVELSSVVSRNWPWWKQCYLRSVDMLSIVHLYKFKGVFINISNLLNLLRKQRHLWGFYMCWIHDRSSKICTNRNLMFFLLSSPPSCG